MVSRRVGHGPGRSSPFTSLFSTNYYRWLLFEALPCKMDTDPEFKIQTRFEKHAEFVALQNDVLSLDISPQTSDEETNRRINLMRDMVNIVR
jgi:hypothetical protein